MVQPLPEATAVEMADLEPAPLLVDTHAHLHFDQFAGEVDGALHRARQNGVGKIVTVGVNTADSGKAVGLAATYENVWATVGVHPHEAGEIDQGRDYLEQLATRRKVVAIGECGFDFFKSKTSLEEQEAAVRAQIEIALRHHLPVVFHVREAFDHFFKVIADYPEVTGVVHSFSAGLKEMERSIDAGLYVALNGIMTFSKNEEQLEAARQVPLNRLLLETDCPFLSPVPFRGQTNEPARISNIAEFLAELRREEVKVLSLATSRNAETLLGI